MNNTKRRTLHNSQEKLSTILVQTKQKQTPWPESASELYRHSPVQYSYKEKIWVLRNTCKTLLTRMIILRTFTVAFTFPKAC
jgi:hypothetical protein